MNQRLIILLCTIGLLVGLTACGGTQAAAPAAADGDSITLTLGAYTTPR